MGLGVPLTPQARLLVSPAPFNAVVAAVAAFEVFHKAFHTHYDTLRPLVRFAVRLAREWLDL